MRERIQRQPSGLTRRVIAVSVRHLSMRIFVKDHGQQQRQRHVGNGMQNGAQVRHRVSGIATNRPPLT